MSDTIPEKIIKAIEELERELNSRKTVCVRNSCVALRGSIVAIEIMKNDIYPEYKARFYLSNFTYILAVLDDDGKIVSIRIEWPDLECYS